VTGSEIMAVVGFFVMLFGFLFGLWKYVENKISGARLDAQGSASAAQALAALAREEIAAHRLHCAETYITKAGMRETTEQIMDAISGVKQAVDHMTARVDRIVENQAKPRTTRSG
jgi:ubiquinone biosynthesis protein UbiJ